MHTSPINFCGRTEYLCAQGATKKESLKEIDREIKAACVARRAGIDAPNYQAVIKKPGDPFRIKHEIKGDVANTKTNPITPKHIDNLLQNFYLMDKMGFYHKNLSSPNIYYSEDGRVEFGSMGEMVRFGFEDGKFSLKNNNVPNYLMPSNAERFETSTLCRYVHNLNEDEKFNFMREYLTQRSDYNETRAELLKEKGFKAKDKALVYETAQHKLFSNPTDETIDYMLSKLEINRVKGNATIMWHKGGGYFDGQVNPNERFASVVMMLQCLKSTLALRDRADLLSKTADTEEVRQFFAFEKDMLDTLAKDTYEETQTGGLNNFCNKTFAGNKGLYLGCAQDRDLFNELFSEIDISGNSVVAEEKIDAVIEYYTNLIKDWTQENNQMYKMQYLKNGVKV